MSESSKNNMVSMDEFLAMAGVKLSTVRKNIDKIPGLDYKNGEFLILNGTRYPFNLRGYKLKNSADRRYVLLKAISEYKYIDSLKLGVYQEQFKSLLKELLEAKLICENGLPNHFGANAYDCTRMGDEVLRLEKSECIHKISELISSPLGHFVGAIISKLY